MTLQRDNLCDTWCSMAYSSGWIGSSGCCDRARCQSPSNSSRCDEAHSSTSPSQHAPMLARIPRRWIGATHPPPDLR